MKVSLAKGTRDFSPIEMQKRNFIFNNIKKAFEQYAFAPIETPSFENYQTLMGKYGEEGDRLIFKILNNGEYLKKIESTVLEEKNYTQLTPKICDRALRYDLTVPFARYVVMNQSKLTFPFKRYQIQPVWRADRPQRGRYREFFQCDADIIGSDSLVNEVELVQLYDQVFSGLGLDVSIRMNNRKILAGIAEIADIENKFGEFTVILDKLDKIGLDKVLEELSKKEIADSSIEIIKKFLELQGSNDEIIQGLSVLLAHSEIGQKGIEELTFVLGTIKELGLNKSQLVLDLTLARGLDYYTGAIFEVTSNEVQLGSIGGGGRYDNLTGIFGLKNMSGVGISFGLDRIYLVLEELGLFPEYRESTCQVCFINFGIENTTLSLKLIKELRAHNISAEFYPESSKMKKQMNYANKKQIPIVVLIGEDEIKKNTAIVKNMSTGEQKELDQAVLSTEISQILSC
ncbi:MAG: histidine--tRNA ligase [Flavobacteriales bacterium]|jgi:histidyl-tRNA synthetase|nr:histidine--tRNA ligase [Flavobacteriales bacterium]